jgi:hypothetical protein
MSKLFEYFTIIPADKNGIRIKVKSTKLEKFFKDTKIPLDGDFETKYYMARYADSQIKDKYARRSLTYIANPRYAINNDYAHFNKNLIPYMGFLTHQNIGQGLVIDIKTPITKGELSQWFSRIFEYSQRLKTTIEAWYANEEIQYFLQMDNYLHEVITQPKIIEVLNQ